MPSIRTSPIDTPATAATAAINFAVLLLNDDEGVGISKMIWRLDCSVGAISLGSGKGGSSEYWQAPPSSQGGSIEYQQFPGLVYWASLGAFVHLVQ